MHNAALPAMSGLPCIGRLMARGFASSASASSAASHGSADASTLIRNVWCLGRSYAEHIRELDNAGPGGTIPQGPPMIFLKAGSSCLPSGQPLLLPKWSSDVHHEVELALQLGPDLRPVRGAVALDLTLRDVQVRRGIHACKHGTEDAHARMDAVPACQGTAVLATQSGLGTSGCCSACCHWHGVVSHTTAPHLTLCKLQSAFDLPLRFAAAACPQYYSKSLEQAEEGAAPLDPGQVLQGLHPSGTVVQPRPLRLSARQPGPAQPQPAAQGQRTDATGGQHREDAVQGGSLG